MNTKNFLAGAGFALTLGLSAAAHAALVVFTASQSGFTRDSDTVNAAFHTALGGSYTHLSFAGASDTNGASYSSAVVFSTQASGFGGSNTSLVNASSEIGPFGNWYGILNMAFASPVSAVGFGIVDPVAVSVYDPAGNLLGTFNSPGGTFNMWGVVATAGEQIGDVKLDGPFYAIQDIAFTGAPAGVPEPAAWTLMLVGIGGMGAALRTRRRAVAAQA